MAFNETQQELNNLRNLTWQNGKLIELMENGAGAISKEVDSGKELIAKAINNVGGEASADESLSQLAQDIEQMPIVNVGCFKFSSAPNLVSIITKQSIQTASTQWADQDFREKLIEIDDTEGVITSIPNYCFNNFPNLKKVVLKNATSLGNSAFRNTSLDEVVLDNATSIGESCFGIADNGGSHPLRIIADKCTSLGTMVLCFSNTYGARSRLKILSLGSFVGSFGTAFSRYSRMFNFANLILLKIGENYDKDFLGIALDNGIYWTASTYLTTSQDQWENRLTLYTNLLEYTLKRLYDHSQDGVTRTFRLGFYNTLASDAELTTEPYGSYYTPLIKAKAQECLDYMNTINWQFSA